ncbi:MAG: hypothetical protein JHC54_03610 [Acinetobacter sp.]|nr:hypothetical protein [Acinetobacter sp.]
MKFATLISALFFCTASFAHADTSFSKNESYNENQVSADIQGFGNRVLDQVGKSKYIKFDQQKTEYAYTITRYADSDIKYTGNPLNIKGVRFIKVQFFKDGTPGHTQVSTFTPSKYNNAIKIVKMDRDDDRPYEFDLGMDSDNKLYIINNNGSTTQLQQVNEIKRHIPLTEKYKDMIF